MSGLRAMLDRVTRALGRTRVPQHIPDPPTIDPQIARLVKADNDLLERFVRLATESRMAVYTVSRDALPGAVLDVLKQHACKRVAVAVDGLNLSERKGIEFTPARAISRDELYDFDASITPVEFAIAETGSLVIRGSAAHPRTLSLVPPVHIAIMEPAQIIPDLVDLFERLAHHAPDNCVIITGPSKTADIEGQLVTGVHGPGAVHVFIVR